jgi:hypothetical protein
MDQEKATVITFRATACFYGYIARGKVTTPRGTVWQVNVLGKDREDLRANCKSYLQKTIETIWHEKFEIDILFDE